MVSPEYVRQPPAVVIILLSYLRFTSFVFASHARCHEVIYHIG